METCIELFGADRCMFESNFPVEKMGIGWVGLWNAFKRIAARRIGGRETRHVQRHGAAHLSIGGQ